MSKGVVLKSRYGKIIFYDNGTYMAVTNSLRRWKFIDGKLHWYSADCECWTPFSKRVEREFVEAYQDYCINNIVLGSTDVNSY